MKSLFSYFSKRINFFDLSYQYGSGLRLMKGFYWNYKLDHHALITGNVSSQRSIFVKELLHALLKVGKVSVISSYDEDIRKFAVLDKVDSLGRLEIIYNDLKNCLGFEVETDELVEVIDYKRPDFILIDDFDILVRSFCYSDREKFDKYLDFVVKVGPSFGINVIISGNKPSADILSTCIRDNLSLRLVVGDVSRSWFSMMFDKDFGLFDEFMRSNIRLFKGCGLISIFGDDPRIYYLPTWKAR